MIPVWAQWFEFAVIADLLLAALIKGWKSGGRK